MPIIRCWNKDCEYWDNRDYSDNCGHPIKFMKDCDKAMIRKDALLKSKNFYYEQLISDECYCGKSKRPPDSFCYTCYKSLPEDLQRDLYQPMGHGYESTYESAVKHLEAS